MGIPGLLPFMKRACRQGNISEFAGQTVAVDTSCWLHRGVSACMDKIAQGQATDIYINYVLRYVHLLLQRKCHVILVFDGRSLPSKKSTDDQRRERRRVCRAQAERLMAEGKTDEAADVLRSCTEVTWHEVSAVIRRCREIEHVDCLVSPYESDAQLAFLERIGVAQLIITEDSDLIPYGGQKVVYKLNASDGVCSVYDGALAYRCFGRGASPSDDLPPHRLRRVCILAGCDYVEGTGLPGVGITRAAKFFAMTSVDDPRVALKRIPRYLKMPNLKVTAEYIEDFIRAENTFLYQLVYNPLTQQLRPLTSYPDKTTHRDYPYAGDIIAEESLQESVVGNRCPTTGETSKENYNPARELATWSIWHPSFKPGERHQLTSLDKSKSKSPPKVSCFEVVEAKKVIHVADRKRKAAVAESVYKAEERRIFSLYAQGITSTVADSTQGESAAFSPANTSRYFEDEQPECSPVAAVVSPPAVSSKARNPFKKPRSSQELPTDDSSVTTFSTSNCAIVSSVSPNNKQPCNVESIAANSVDDTDLTILTSPRKQAPESQLTVLSVPSPLARARGGGAFRGSGLSRAAGGSSPKKASAAFTSPLLNPFLARFQYNA